jgi:light-regulated signal transduction histidine kinase (bacteriophytochrome)
VRRIEALCIFLKDDYEALMDEAGKDLLKHITESTVLMNSLIEDLLKLSRITRQTLSKSPCNLSEMALKICEDLKLTYPLQKVSCRVEENIIVQADHRLLQIALQNLIDNAWKYSSKNENAEIIIGTETRDHKKIIFIRDNGVGFDMDKAKNLFTPFQRLHSEVHFKGTGIGLATVKRVIVKHGGIITVHSEPGKGATFSFSL